MSEPPHHIPWPVWAAVTLTVALIGAAAIRYGTRGDPAAATAPAQVLGPVERPAPAREGAFTRVRGTPGPAADAEAIQFTIHDNLGRAQLEEAVRILIDGEYVGTLRVSPESPSATLRVQVPGPGRYSWTAQAEATFVDEDGNKFQHAGTGQGIVMITEGSSFDVRGIASGPTWTISLERDNSRASH